MSTPKSTEKRDLLAEEYMRDNYATGYSPDKNYCMHFGPNDMKKAICAGYSAAQKEAQGRIEELEGVLNLKEDEYVRQVGTWKIIQRLEEERDKLELTVKRLEGAVQEYLNFKDDYAAGRAPEGYLICVKYRQTLENNMREALSREGKGEKV